ncbi:hypothetical protein DCAR_0310849 [Daucus carota subsp. sativus]|uniref:Uncharacterized protein n=1 Tax=Daucus carota subsp. sativus TaxID=79200 RepID=A0A166A7Y8_DAUCS|nr:hypothetical protein DCAR_0310849 [Daucus carota subsp. sativus]
MDCSNNNHMNPSHPLLPLLLPQPPYYSPAPSPFSASLTPTSLYLFISLPAATLELQHLAAPTPRCHRFISMSQSQPICYRKQLRLPQNL